MPRQPVTSVTGCQAFPSAQLSFADFALNGQPTADLTKYSSARLLYLQNRFRHALVSTMYTQSIICVVDSLSKQNYYAGNLNDNRDRTVRGAMKIDLVMAFCTQLTRAMKT